MLQQSSLGDYSDVYILVKGTITITGGSEAANTAARLADGKNKEIIFKNSPPFTNYTSKINNTDVDNAKNQDVVMPMFNLIEYSDYSSETSGSL